jgi:AraC family transcriptional regulator
MPRQQTQASYHDRLARVTDYLYAHLEDDLSFDRLAEIACLSAYHWSRIYTAMQGETVTTTIRRLRLQRAADRLANTDLDIARVAAHAGYGSTDTFARAFRDMFGQAPATYREAGSHAAYKAANVSDNSGGFPVTVDMLPEQRCAGIDHVGSYMQIDHAMGRLFAELVARGRLPAQPVMTGVYFDNPDFGPEPELRSRACLPIDDGGAIEPPMVETVLRGGLYARLSYTGPYTDMRGAYRWLLGTWLPVSGYEPAEAPILEVYLNDPRNVPQSELRTDILLPLEPTT